MTDKDVRFAISAEDRFSRTFQNLKRDIAGVGEGVGKLQSVAAFAVTAVNPVLAVVAAVTGYGIALKKLAGDIDALNDASDAVGDSVENLSAVEDIARRNGESLDLVVTATSRLNKALNDAKPNSPVAQALEDIGLSVKELRNLNPTESLQRVAVALSGFENSQRKASITTEIFGKNSRQVAGFLGDYAKAGQLVATVTSEQALEAEKFNKQLSALVTEAGNAARAVANELLPSINNFFRRINEARAGQGGIFGAVAKQLETDLIRARLAATNDEIARTAEDAQRARAILDRQPDSIRAKATIASFQELQRAAAAYRQELEDLGGYQNGARRPANAGGGQIPFRLPDRPDRPDPPSATAAVVRPAVRVELPPEVAALQDALRRLEQTDVAKIDRLQAELSALFELQRESRGAPAVTRAIQQLNDELDQLGASRLPTTAIDDPREQQRTDFLRSEKEAYDQINESIKNLDKANLDKLTVTIDRFAESTVEALLDIGSGSDFSASKLFDSFRRDVLREFIEEPVKASMKNVVKSIREELGKLDGENNPIAAQLKLLSGGASSVGSAISGFFSGPGSLLGGDGFTSRAMGGGVRAGELVRWNENGREWFVPGQNGTVLTQAQLQGAGGSYSPSYVFHIQGGDPRETARQVRAMLDERDARNERSRRYGKLRGG